MASTGNKFGNGTFDLREQILANAVHAYPSIVKDHLEYHKTGIVNPAEIFDIVVLRSPNNKGFGAFLTHGNIMAREIATVGNGRATTEEALLSLLEDLGELAIDRLMSNRGEWTPGSWHMCCLCRGDGVLHVPGRACNQE